MLPTFRIFSYNPIIERANTYNIALFYLLIFFYKPLKSIS